ncbi:MAG: YmfQ family protein [Acidobacteriota bacterium]|nr:YmfQ family protein [Acidobacteriota bacterium]
MNLDRKKLIELLPAIYRIRDRDAGEPLERLMAVIAEQIEVLQDNVDQLYDDQFIETCAEWVVPYIGDLVGARGIRDVNATGFSARAYVANTLALRRRKGTISVVEQIAADLTGWPASAVEFFLRLAWSQWMNHIRKDAIAWFDVRDSAAVARIGTPFERSLRTADVRRISSGRGLHNIPNIGIFLWRIGAYSLTASPAYWAGAGCWLFSPLGHDAPLFSLPVTEDEITHLATRENVPVPITRRELASDTAAWYGESKSILVRLGGIPVALENVESCNLSGPLGSWEHVPVPPNMLSIDPVLGRLALPDDATIVSLWVGANKTTLAPDPNDSRRYTFGGALPAKFAIRVGGVDVVRIDDEHPTDDRLVPAANPTKPVDDKLLVDMNTGALLFPAIPSPPLVTFHYGMPGDIGGGEYERQASFSDIDAKPILVPDQHPTIAKALIALGTNNGIIEIRNSGRYPETLAIALAANQRVEIRSANNARATIVLSDSATISGGSDSELMLNGLLIASDNLTVGGDLAVLSIRHCTLVPGLSLTYDGDPVHPGEASVIVDADSDSLAIEIASSITGALDVHGEAGEMKITDSIVDAFRETAYAIADRHSVGPNTSAPKTTIERCTIFGRVKVRELTLASNTIFRDRVSVDRRQIGCVRFSYVTRGSSTPQRYKCQPELRPNVRLAFVSTRYGTPAYTQLAFSTDVTITTGADNECEMGVWCALEGARREANLRAALDEYLRFGLEAGIFHVT